MSQTISFEQFQLQYGNADRAYEFWFGQAIPKAMPTWIHGLLQKIVMDLLTEAGYITAPEVELRIDPAAHPRPDVIATSGRPELPYPTRGVDVVVEILSEEDGLPYMRSKCRAYQEWGFAHIYLVDPTDRSVLEWVNGSLLVTPSLVSIAASRIWAALERHLRRDQ